MILRSVPLVASLLLLSTAPPARAQEPPPPPPGDVAPPAAAPPLGATASPPPTDAPPPIPEWRLVLNNLLVLRYNPLGLEDQIRFGVQKKLYDDDSKALRDNFIHLGISPKINPAFIKIGPSLEIQPASFFNLRLGVEYLGYFGSFGYLQSFPSPASEYSDTLISENKDLERNYVTDGSHMMVEPLFQIQVGSIAIRNKLALEYWRMAVRGDDRVFYEATLDTLVPASGFVLQNDLDVLYILQRGWRLAAGIRYTAVDPLYGDSEFPLGESPDLQTFEATDEYRGNSHHRIGPVVAFTFYDDGYTKFNKPTLVLMANWYLSHRYRTGQDKSAALPYLVLGFSFQSDFLEAPAGP